MVACIGDLPLLVQVHGKFTHILIRNVRCVPAFTETLLSTGQLWHDSNVDMVFRNVNHLVLPTDGADFNIPFVRRDELYVLDASPTAVEHAAGIATPAGVPIPAHAFKASAHSPQATSHISVMPPDVVISALHRRLHMGYDRLRKLADVAADVPASIAQGLAHSCAHCLEANAHRLPHTSGSTYKPSHAGRLIHMDTAGPFKLSSHGHFRYFMVLIDDHSRYKQVYCMQKKSDAPHYMRRFVSKFNALGSLGKPEPVRIVGALRSDNAGEFLSQEFKEL